MVVRLVSDDVERLENVRWWSLVSQCISDQLVRTMQCEAETRGCCAVSMWDITMRAGAAIFLTPDGVKRGTRIARMLEHDRWDRVFSATWHLQTFGKVLEKRFEVKQTRHIGFYASDAKKLKILNRTIKIDVLNDEMTLEADMKLVEGALESMKLTGAKGVDSPRFRKNDSTDREFRETDVSGVDFAPQLGDEVGVCCSRQD